MWKNRNVWIILIGEFIAGLGLWTGIIGNLEFMQQKVPSDFHKSLILFAGLLAGVMIGPLAGRVIDQYKKKTILIYSGIGRMISVIFMFLAIEFQSIWWMVLFMISIQLSAAFYFPALQSLIPLIVKDQDLIQLNGVHMNVATISRILGTALAGAMLAIMSLYSLYMASFIAYGFLLFTTILLQVEEHLTDSKGENPKRSKARFVEIIPVLRGLPIAVMGLLLMIVPILFIGGFNLMVIEISELQNDSTIKGLLYTVEGISFMLGAFFVKRISEGKDLLKLLVIFAGIIAIGHLSLYFSDLKLMTLISFALFGIGAGMFFPIASTIFQTRIPKEYHGRFFSFRNMFERVMFQIVLLGTGLFLDTIGLKNMVLIFGTLSLSLVIYFAFRQMKNLASVDQPNPVKHP